jgi:hypothetical protein
LTVTDGRLLVKTTPLMNLLAASYEVSKTARNEASFGEFTPRD